MHALARPSPPPPAYMPLRAAALEGWRALVAYLTAMPPSLINSTFMPIRPWLALALGSAIFSRGWTAVGGARGQDGGGAPSALPLPGAPRAHALPCLKPRRCIHCATVAAPPTRRAVNMAALLAWRWRVVGGRRRMGIEVTILAAVAACLALAGVSAETAILQPLNLVIWAPRWWLHAPLALALLLVPVVLSVISGRTYTVNGVSYVLLWWVGVRVQRSELEECPPRSCPRVLTRPAALPAPSRSAPPPPRPGGSAAAGGGTWL